MRRSRSRKALKNDVNEPLRYILSNLIRYKSIDIDKYNKREYCKIHGSGYTYLFTPNDDALKFISARIKYHRALQNKLAIFYLSIVRRIPRKLIPFKTQIKYPEQLKDVFGELIIISGARMKSFNFSSKQLFTFPLNRISKERLKTEIEVRKRLEEKINLPKILHYDENFPYLVEEIVGYPLYKLDKQTWPLVVDAFGQLITFYKENAVKVTSVKEKLKEIEFILRKEDFKHEYVEIMKNLLKTLNDFIDKNLLITLTHGDLYLGNLVSDGKTIYITDWDYPRERLILSDFIYMLFRYYIDSGSVGVIYSLLTEEKNMHRKYIIKILEEFDKNFNIGLLSDLNMLKCYLVLGVLERIPLFESPTFQKLIFKRLKRMLHVIK